MTVWREAIASLLARRELKTLIAQRRWEDDACFLGEGSVRPDSVVLASRAGGWEVYLVDERATVVESTRRHFSTEVDALAHMRLKLEQTERARQAIRRLPEGD